MTGPATAVWPALALAATGWGLVFGVPIWLAAGVLACSIFPHAAGSFLRTRPDLGDALEAETALWIVLAAAAMAGTGGASSPMAALFAVPLALASGRGEARLRLEAPVMTLLGWGAGALGGAAGSWAPAEHAAVMAACFGLAGLVQTALLLLAAGDANSPGAAKDDGSGNAAAGKVLDAELIASLARAADLEQRLKLAQARVEQGETELQAARRRVEQAEGSLADRTRFFAQTSHELRTPLNAIIGFADMIRSQVFGPVGEKYVEYAQLIKEGGDNLQIVVDDVTDLARIEAGRYEIDPELLSLTDIAADCVRFMAEGAARRQVELTLDSPEDIEAHADARAVRQIILNLVSNALKFTPGGGAVTVRAGRGERGALLSVSDTGVGIAPEELERLSRAFEQGEAGRKEKGSGLGLSVVRAFVDLHGGRMTIASSPGGGTTVSVSLPDRA